jgi:hypothetical protein
MLYEYTHKILSEANKAAENQLSSREVYQYLRPLPLADFCSTIFQDQSTFGSLSRLLPKMPPVEIQRRWTGHYGNELVTKSCNIIRLMQLCSYFMRNSKISGTLLDYGCGWGRLTRLLTYFSDPESIYGADPMQDSLEACRSHQVHGKFIHIPTKPQLIPLDGKTFDFAVAYSVFTHTPPNVTSAILDCLRRSASADALLVCTIRPIEFWNLRCSLLGDEVINRLKTSNRNDGFAFLPVGGGVELQRDEYGDTSMEIEFFSKIATAAGWKVGFVDRDSLEPFQIMLGLSPVN